MKHSIEQPPQFLKKYSITFWKRAEKYFKLMFQNKDEMI